MDKKQTPAMLLKIKSMRENLSKAELLVCDYIIEHPEEVIYLSVSELAAKSGVSDATVIRASQKIGSSSYQDLKISLAQDIVTPLQSVNEEIEAGDPTNVVVEKVFQGILHTLNTLTGSRTAECSSARRTCSLAQTASAYAALATHTPSPRISSIS